MKNLIRFNGDGGDSDLVSPDDLHLNGAGGPDYTLCGITLDGDSETAGSYEVVEGKAVTCPDCIAIIRHCRGVRIPTKGRKA